MSSINNELYECKKLDKHNLDQSQFELNIKKGQKVTN